jgi:hypothetical protein
MQELTDDFDRTSGTSEFLLESKDFQIRCADTRGRRSKSSALIRRMYSWRGYNAQSEEDQPPEANQVTVQAFSGETVFGTLTVRFDSADGLAADALYRSEIDAYRSRGANVCELTRLAVDPLHGSKDVLGALFHLAYIFGAPRGVTDVFVEVNPRHVGFYKRMLKFEDAGELKMCPRVNAPAILLHLSVEYVTQQIAEKGGHRGNDKRSLYPYFFSAAEAEGLARRL